jgi:Tol biopolymer transport system component
VVTNKLFILLILSIIIGLSSACSEPVGTPIYFQSDRDGQWEIYSIWHDGTNLQRLTEDQASDANPSLSLDGTKLAWIKTIDGATDIYTMNPDGTGAQNLSNGGIPGVIDYVTWSFKGNLLIVSVSDPQVADGNHQIYSINSADGSSYTRLTKDDSIKHRHPRVNMQGLGYIVSAGTSDDSMDLLLIDLEGKARATIPKETFRASGNFQELGNSEDYATFQSTGRALMFSTNLDGDWEIYRVEPDGRKPGNITNQPDSNQTRPDWGGALDGVTFAYVSDQDGNQEIYTYSSDRGVPTRVTVNDAIDTNPTWIKERVAE